MSTEQSVTVLEDEDEDELSQQEQTISSYLEEITGKGLIKIREKILNKISKLGLSLADFTSRKNITVSPLNFPNQEITIVRLRDDSGPNAAPYFDTNLGLDLLRDLNDINRSVTSHEVYKQVINILTGVYDENQPDGIYFSKDRKLLNGQKRLLAVVIAGCINSDVKIRFPVEFNHSRELIKVIDIPEKRTQAHIVEMTMKQEGIEFNNALYNGQRVTQLMEVVNSMFKTASMEERTSIFRQHRDLIVKFVETLRKAKHVRFNASWVACFVKAALPNFFGEKVMLPIAEKFAMQQFDGDGDPLRELYNRLSKAGQQRLYPADRYGLVLKALRRHLIEGKVDKLHPSYIDWTEREAQDYAIRGKDSRVLFAMSRKNVEPKAKKKSDKKQVSGDDTD